VRTSDCLLAAVLLAAVPDAGLVVIVFLACAG
jgi:hypothetical protein